MMSCRKYDGQYIFIKLVSPQELVNLWKEKHLQLFVRISLLRAIDIVLRIQYVTAEWKPS